MPDANSAAIQLIPLAGVPQGYQSGASFSPHGTQLAFTQRGKQNPGIYTTLVDGERSFRLTNNPGDCCPAWSPDGQQIAFSRYSDREIAVYLISVLGGAEHQLHQTRSAFKQQPDAQAANFSWNTLDMWLGPRTPNLSHSPIGKKMGPTPRLRGKYTFPTDCPYRKRAKETFIRERGENVGTRRDGQRWGQTSELHP